MYKLKYIVRENTDGNIFVTEIYNREEGMVYPRENKSQTRKTIFSGQDTGVCGKRIAAVEVEINHLLNRSLVIAVGKAMFVAGRKFERSLSRKDKKAKKTA